MNKIVFLIIAVICQSIISGIIAHYFGIDIAILSLLITIYSTLLLKGSEE